jgi:hypothetical protein
MKNSKSKTAPSAWPGALFCAAFSAAGFCCLAFSYAGTEKVLLGMVGTLLTFFAGLMIGLNGNK